MGPPPPPCPIIVLVAVTPPRDPRPPPVGGLLLGHRLEVPDGLLALDHRHVLLRGDPWADGGGRTLRPLPTSYVGSR